MKRIKDSVVSFRRILIILTHLFIIVFSFWLAFLLRFDFNIPLKYWITFYHRLPILLCSKVIAFVIFGTFSGLWQYVSIDDVWKIAKASLTATIIFILSEISLFGLQDFPRTIFAIDWIICTGLVIGIRFTSRYIRERYYHNYKFGFKKILIVGAGATGVMLLREYRKHPDMGKVVGFMDDDRVKLNETIHGIKVWGTRRAIPKVAERFGVDEIVIAMPEVRGDQMREV
ncbi:MAG: hypothetical protein PHE15_02170, partial [Dehalococcoidales bacterium]|nr:hypothetical protein [Dehalococcoidales bacterium]